MTVSNTQLELINKAKKYIQKKSNENINVDSSGNCFFCAWGITPGYAILKIWQEGFKNFFNALKIFIKDIISISNLYNYYLVNNLNNKTQFNKIIVSWGFKSRFLPDGSYDDRYFKINSKDTDKALWFLIYTDETMPENISNNILILTKSNSKLIYSFSYLLKTVVMKIISSKFSVRKFFHSLSSSTEFSKIVCDKLKQFITTDIKTIIMPYECQPFQNKIFKISKNMNKEIRTIGYVHAFPVGLPTNYIFRDGSPDKLILSGEDQFYCLKKYLNWTSSKLKVLPSTRYSKTFEDMSGSIFLPLFFNSSDIIIKSLKNLLKNRKDINISNLVVKNHSLTLKSKKHIKIIEEINNLLQSYKKLLSTDKKSNSISIFIGSTSSPIEALERGLEVIHICDDPVFQSYNNILWPSIKVEAIDDNTYKYQLSKKGNLIQLGDSDKVFNQSYIN